MILTILVALFLSIACCLGLMFAAYEIVLGKISGYVPGYAYVLIAPALILGATVFGCVAFVCVTALLGV